MTGSMRSPVLASMALVLMLRPHSADAQLLLGKSKPQQVSLAATASTSVVKAGSSLTLWAEVTPNRAMHVYAAGAADFTPVSIALTPNPAVTVGRATYPKPARAQSPGTIEAVPAYNEPFRIGVPVTIASTAKAGDALTIGGAVTYQACDDRLCYPVNVAPVTWNITVQ